MEAVLRRIDNQMSEELMLDGINLTDCGQELQETLKNIQVPVLLINSCKISDFSIFGYQESVVILEATDNKITNDSLESLTQNFPNLQVICSLKLYLNRF